MIANASVGKGFGGLVQYLLRGRRGDSPERVEWTATRNLPLDDLTLVAPLMQATATQNRRVESPVYHLSVSLRPGETLAREDFERLVDRVLHDLGLQDHQALLVAHNDTEHQHVHVMVNRVHPDTTRAWHNGHDYARIEKSLRQLERELGLGEVRGRHFSLPDHERVQGGSQSLPMGALQVQRRTGRPSFVELSRQLVRPEFRRARSWVELHRRLDTLGLGLAKRGRGLVLRDGERMVKASLVDRRASLAKLEARFGPWQPPSKSQRPSAERWRDVVLLRRLGERLSRDQAAEESQEQAARAERFERHQAAEELERQTRQLSRRLDRQLDRIYRDPAGARRLLLGQMRDAADLSTKMVQSPEVFGRLRGRGGIFSSAERWEALDGVPEAAATLRELARLSRVPAPSLRTPRPVVEQRRARRLDRLAGRLIHKLGWKLAARVLPLPHLHALRLALDVSRSVLAPTQDLGRER